MTKRKKTKRQAMLNETYNKTTETPPIWNLLNGNKGTSRRGDGYGWYPSECQATFDDNV